MLPKETVNEEIRYQNIEEIIKTYHEIFRHSRNQEYKNVDVGHGGEYIEILKGPDLQFAMKYIRTEENQEEYLIINSGEYIVRVTFYNRRGLDTVRKYSSIILEKDQFSINEPNLNGDIEIYMKDIVTAMNNAQPLKQIPPFEPSTTQV